MWWLGCPTQKRCRLQFAFGSVVSKPAWVRLDGEFVSARRAISEVEGAVSSVRVVRWAVDPAACKLMIAAPTTAPEESVTMPRRVPSMKAVWAAHDCTTNKIHKDRMTARAHQRTRDWPGCSCGCIKDSRTIAPDLDEVAFRKVLAQ